MCYGRIERGVINVSALWALSRKDISGESLALEAATLIAKWVARGLEQSVLQSIRTNVFNVGAPVAP